MEGEVGLLSAHLPPGQSPGFGVGLAGNGAVHEGGLVCVRNSRDCDGPLATEQVPGHWQTPGWGTLHWGCPPCSPRQVQSLN